jgi:NADH-quinone oxidoreductase subunit C
MPDAPGLELIAQDLNETAAGSVLGTYHEHGQACLIVDPERILDLLRWLRDTPGQEYRFLASLHGVDYLPAEPRFGVVYELMNMPRVERLRVRAALADPGADPSEPGSPRSRRRGDDPSEPGRPRSRRRGGDRLPEIDSCVSLFPTAEFHEREVYDFFGIVFRGHPDLRRILMPEDYVGWPQRRDFPLGGEPVIFTHNEREVPRWYE